MKRVIVHLPKRKEVKGDRVVSKQFGGGTIVKDGPEQALVRWDDPRYDTFSDTYTPNSHFKRL